MLFIYLDIDVVHKELAANNREVKSFVVATIVAM